MLGVGGRNPIQGAEVCSGASSCPAELGFVALLSPGWVGRQRGLVFFPMEGRCLGLSGAKRRGEWEGAELGR